MSEQARAERALSMFGKSKMTPLMSGPGLGFQRGLCVQIFRISHLPWLIPPSNIPPCSGEQGLVSGRFPRATLCTGGRRWDPSGWTHCQLPGTKLGCTWSLLVRALVAPASQQNPKGATPWDAINEAGPKTSAAAMLSPPCLRDQLHRS